jgi:FkbM family methyltransferase
MAWLVRQSNGCVLDIGANTGVFSLLAAAANPGIRVCAFEPLESVCMLLRDNLALNPDLADRISVYPFALSNASGSCEFYETINGAGLVTTSSSLELAHVLQVGAFRRHVIPIDTIDGWTATLGLGGIALIKIDVEGHEYAVMEGGRATMSHHRPWLTIEVLGNAPAEYLTRMVDEIGYCDFVISPGQLRYCAVVRHDPYGWNHLLCPAESVSRLLQGCRELGLRLEIDPA